MKLSDTTVQIIVGYWIASYVSLADADVLKTQEMSNQSCGSISGIYQFLGQDDDGDSHRRSFPEALFGTLLLSGKATATELNYNAASSLLRVKINRENLDPDPDVSLKVKCKEGAISFEDSKSGHADGSSYEMKSIFRISKDSAGALVVHKIYTVKSTNLLFFSKERNGEVTTRFRPVRINGVD